MRVLNFLVLFFLATISSKGLCQVIELVNYPQVQQITPFSGILPQVVEKRLICEEVAPEEIRYFLYTKTNFTEISVLNTKVLESFKSLKIIIHSWNENAQTQWVQTMKDEYLKKGEEAVILFDWSKFSSSDYDNIYCLIPKIGETVARAILLSKYNPSLVHYIGYSVGAHLAGAIGFNVQEYSGRTQQIGRITGLDPAKQLYCPGTPTMRLSPDDASFVDVIHTDTVNFGCKEQLGLVDFYPNCGVEQPGCKTLPELISKQKVQVGVDDLYCSSKRSYQYFTESISSPRFQAFRLQDCFYDKPTGNPVEIVTMGEDVQINAFDKYYLSTNASPPFAKPAVA